MQGLKLVSLFSYLVVLQKLRGITKRKAIRVPRPVNWQVSCDS